jgi:UDP-N-acetylglucosamine 2-epimerase
MKIVSIVGARPEFVQAMPVSRALRRMHQEVLVHTGQHYDYRMSQAFFDELEIPIPDYNLEVGSGSHARQTAEILVRLEEVFIREKPDVVIVRGDTNSTLAGALAAAKLHIPIAHVEAGERSFDRRMPEEINRLMADGCADLFFCVSQEAVHHLEGEGICNGVHHVGDVMLDALNFTRPLARRKSQIIQNLGLQAGRYALATVHRAANTDDSVRLKGILSAMNQVGEMIVFPVHPRTRKAIAGLDFSVRETVRLIEPVGYYDMLALEENARMIATDSGGVQREAYYLSIPCLTLRDETEWTGTVDAGWNRLVGANEAVILENWQSFQPPADHPPIYGDGRAAEAIAEILTRGPVSYNLSRRSS